MITGELHRDIPEISCAHEPHFNTIGETIVALARIYKRYWECHVALI